MTGESPTATSQMVETVIRTSSESGSLTNLKKSHATPKQIIQWLGILWDTKSQTLALATNNNNRFKKKLFLALVSQTFTKKKWESRMGSLNFEVEVVSLGYLQHCLLWELVVPFPNASSTTTPILTDALPILSLFGRFLICNFFFFSFFIMNHS